MTPLRYRRPPRLHTDDGKLRRVGVEVEFAGVSLDDAIGLVERLYDGRAHRKSRFEASVETRLGDFRVEVDSKLLTEQRYLSYLERMGIGDRGREVVEDALESIVRFWVPCEIVTPPLPLDELPGIERLRVELHRAAALGTRASVLYGFAFQLNPEIASFDARSLRDHLQAFLLSYEWLLEVVQPDFTRRIGPFIHPFPEEYRRYVLDPAYDPDLDGLINDYLTLNPTRNRPLDMLPAFALVRPEKVYAVAREGNQVKPRPTFHYRLPNCLIDEPDWSFAVEWNRWCEVERLAADRARLVRLMQSFRDRTRSRGLQRKVWISEVASARPSRPSFLEA